MRGIIERTESIVRMGSGLGSCDSSGGERGKLGVGVVEVVMEFAKFSLLFWVQSRRRRILNGGWQEVNFVVGIGIEMLIGDHTIHFKTFFGLTNMKFVVHLSNPGDVSSESYRICFQAQDLICARWMILRVSEKHSRVSAVG